MLTHLEETINIKNFFRNSISEKTMDNAHTILKDAHELCRGINNECDLRFKFESIDTRVYQHQLKPHIGSCSLYPVL